MTQSIQWIPLRHLASLLAGGGGRGKSPHKLLLPLCRSSPASVSLISSCAGSAASNWRTMHSASSGSEWKGLGNWRAAPIDERRFWGKNCPAVESSEMPEQQAMVEREQGEEFVPSAELAKWGALVLCTAEPIEKARLTHQAYRLWKSGRLEVGTGEAPDVPGRPSKPDLVPPRQLPTPKESNLSASAHMLHNLAHIELNAIDLAWDTVVRFSHASDELGRDFFADFLHVADDESRHFRWCSQRLNELGFKYGDMPAHNLLWKDCMRTSGSVKSRLAVIPMMQEARGLDAGPRLVKRLLGLDDHRSAAIVRRIGQEEVAHVGVGVCHFLRVCKKLGVDPGVEFKELMVECNVQLHGPFNHRARALAGLEREWYDPVEASEEELNSQSNMVEKTSKKMDSKPIEQSAVAKGKGEGVLESKSTGTSLSFLPAVFERLVLLVAMEKENAGS